MLLRDLLPKYVNLPSNYDNLIINNIRIHPHRILPGDLYISYLYPAEAKSPNRKEIEFKKIKEAIERGATVVIKDKINSIVLPLANIIEVDNLGTLTADIASFIYPGQPPNIVAVTGTCGKTSIVNFTQQLWAGLKYQSASIGSLGIEGNSINKDDYPPLLFTTPEPFLMHYTMKKLAENNITHAAIEASSHGLHQDRLHRLNIKAAAFSNLSYEHVAYHGSMEQYFQAKLRLFSEILPHGALSILNEQDPYSQRIKIISENRGHHLIWVGGNKSDISIYKIKYYTNCMEVTLRIFGTLYKHTFNLIGKFQIENILFAIGFVIGLGGNIEKTIEQLSIIKSIAGRMELMGELPNKAQVYVDYAHKADALKNVLIELKKHLRKNITLVFGCAGNNNLEKIKLMGTIANNFADKVIITDDNPRQTDPEEVRSQIFSCCPKAKVIASRKEAIKFAISELSEGEGCIIAGKGNESGQIIKGKVIASDDREEVLKYLYEEGRLINKN
jgi:UDP-N-acetylmuramoyl-L-alanyl-D-glutamate--2,6-diaminopimelate ligase